MNATRRKYMVGQQCVGSVSGATGSSIVYQWTVAGSRPFKSYDPTAAANQLTAMGIETGDSVVTHFAAEGSPSLTCNVDMTFFDGTSASVTLSKNTTVELPDLPIKSGVIGGVYPAPVIAPYNGAQLKDSGDANRSDEGVVFRVKVTTPAAYGGGGSGAWNQLVTLGTTQTLPTGTLRATVAGATIGMNDGGFPYENELDPGVFPAGSATHLMTDAPYYAAFDVDSTSYSVSDQFKMYLLYKPPGTGSMFVPLGYFSWGWSASASRPLHGAWSAPSGSGSGPTWTETATHPEWSVVASGINWQP